MGFAIANLERRWPDGRIPFQIDAVIFPPGSSFHDTIVQAIDHWNSNSVVTLVPRTDADVDYAVFVSATDVCQSPVGRQTGRQEIRCDSRDFRLGNVIHEIGHAAGLLHEHQRPDRDDFVTINEENIDLSPEQFQTNFGIREDGVTLGEYDFASIMHYSRKIPSFAVDQDLDVITPPNGVDIGQRRGLSGRDVWGVGVLYGTIDFAVAWQDDSDRNGVFEIHLAAFNRLGRRCLGDITVNVVGTGQQRRPDVTLDASSGPVVVWEDDRNTNGFFDINARAFNRDGTDRFRDVSVNANGSGQQLKPSIASTADGHIFVTWEDDANHNGLFQILARGLNPDGSPRFADIVVNQSPSGQQRRPDLAVMPDGGFVVVWQDDRDRNGVHQVFARGFHADGSERFAEIVVNSQSSGQQLQPRLAIGRDGAFVVVWEDDANENGAFEIRARGFNEDGSQRFAEFTVNSDPSGEQRQPDVAAAPDGAFVIVWADDKNRNGRFDILARSFDENGTELLSDVTVNTVTAGQQVNPRVAVGSDRAFVVVWEDDSDRNGFFEIFARGFRADGAELFAPILVNRVSSGTQRAPAVAKPAFAAR